MENSKVQRVQSSNSSRHSSVKHITHVILSYMPKGTHADSITCDHVDLNFHGHKYRSHPKRVKTNTTT